MDTPTFTSLNEKNWDPFLRSLVERFSITLQKSFGCRFSYQPWVEFSEKNLWLSQYINKHIQGTGPQAITFENTIYCPIFADHTLVGVAILAYSKRPSEELLSHILDIVDVIFATALRKCTEIDLLVQKERSLYLLADRDKVIALRQRRTTDDASSGEPISQKIPLAAPVLIEGENRDLIHRVAIDIHHATSRFAFISLKDLSTEVQNNLRLLNGIGFISIFIPEISEIGQQQQIQLNEYLAYARLKRTPQIIAGSTKQTHHLLEQNLIHPELLEQFATSRIHIPKTLPKQSEINYLVEFFLQSQHLPDPQFH